MSEMDVDTSSLAATDEPPNSSKHVTVPRSPQEVVIPSVERDDTGTPNTPSEESATLEQEQPREASKSSSSSSVPPVEFAAGTNKQHKEKLLLNGAFTHLQDTFKETSAAAIQGFMRENWRPLIFQPYDEEHISFILRAGLKNSSPKVLERVLKDGTIFKEPLLALASKKNEVIERVLRAATPEQILRLLPESVLDRVLGERIKTVPARQLINWLAGADRLGYQPDDILDDENESVVPSSRPTSQEAPFQALPPPPIPQQGRDPLLDEQERQLMLQRQQKQQPPHGQPVVIQFGEMVCGECKQTFSVPQGYCYHITRKFCKGQPRTFGKWWCQACMKTFTTKTGMEYHLVNRVCLDFEVGRETASGSFELLRAAPSGQPGPPQPYPPYGQYPPPPQSMGFQGAPFAAPPPVYHGPLPAPPPPPPPNAQRPDFKVEVQSRPVKRSSPGSVPRPPLNTPQAPKQGSYGSQKATPSSTPGANRPTMSSTPGPGKPTNTPSSNPNSGRKQALRSEVRVQPQDLPPAKRAELEQALNEAEQRYQAQINDIPADTPEKEREQKLTSYKNSIASKKSQIRRNFGVTLRMRDNDKQARLSMIGAEASTSGSKSKDRIQEFRAPGTGSSAPTKGFTPTNGNKTLNNQGGDSHSNKRRRTDTGSSPEHGNPYGLPVIGPTPNPMAVAPTSSHTPIGEQSGNLTSASQTPSRFGSQDLPIAVDNPTTVNPTSGNIQNEQRVNGNRETITIESSDDSTDGDDNDDEVIPARAPTGDTGSRI